MCTLTSCCYMLAYYVEGISARPLRRLGNELDATSGFLYRCPLAPHPEEPFQQVDTAEYHSDNLIGRYSLAVMTTPIKDITFKVVPVRVRTSNTPLMPGGT